MIKTVLFDFGGVLTETGKKGFIRQVLADLYGMPVDELFSAELQKSWRRNEVDEAVILEKLNKRYGKHITPRMFAEQAHADVIRSEPVYLLAQQLRADGMQVGILSNVFSSTAAFLREQGFYDGFDPVVLSCEVGYAKPDEELYKAAIRQSGHKAHEILFIDDQEKCRPPAEKLGIHFLLATSPEQIVTETAAIINREKER